jgi:hypothetical protein
MSAELKPLTDFLVELGIEKVPHTEKSYLAHLIAVHRDLRSWGCPEEVCLGGMFHSIYGTEMFQGFTLPLERRGELRRMIGDRAERLAYLNCAMDRPTFDANFLPADPARGRVSPRRESEPRRDSATCRWRDRITGEELELPRKDFEDLTRIHLCDWLEQVPRSKKWDYRRQAYREMARRLGGVAQEAYDRVFAREVA